MADDMSFDTYDDEAVLAEARRRVDNPSFDVYDDEDIAAWAGHAQARKKLHDVYGPAVEAPTEEDEAVLAEWRRRLEARGRL